MTHRIIRPQMGSNSLRLLGGLLLCILFARPAAAKPHEIHITLHEGQVVLSDFCAPLCRELGIDPIKVPAGKLDVNGMKGSNFIAAVDEALGDGCRVNITDNQLVLHVDTKKLPKDCDATKRAVRLFTAVEAPESTAAQRRNYGLTLPEHVDPNRPIVVLVHGLDSNQTMWGPLAGSLANAGQQVAYFSYPGDGPIDDSAAMLAARLAELHASYPQTKIDLICHSMGGLVARAAIEGPQYSGGVDRLFLCGTPNAGSSWAKYQLVLEIQEHYHLWKTDPNWSPTWMITDGLGEAGRDMKPGSKFLKRLNARPRPPQVKYTIIAGTRHPVRQIGADWFDCTANCLPRCMSDWWGLRQCRQCMTNQAESIRHKDGDSDGPVELRSAKLEGVSDFVIVHADHASLCCGDSPAAWPAIRDRLKN